MKRVVFLTGYYGSGKSELAMNIAIQKNYDTIVDLDIINPYFRTREMEDVLKTHGIDMISSDVNAKMHLDMPYISKRIFNPLYNEKHRVIYDLGGNDQGAKLLRQFDDYRDIDYDLFLVVNIFRSETDSVEKIIELVNRIEGMGSKKITGLINNSNLLKETREEEIMRGQEIVETVSDQLAIPLIFTSYWDKLNLDLNVSNETLKINLYFRKNWL